MRHRKQRIDYVTIMAPNQTLYEWLAHPLLLLIIGALISALLVPWLTQRWQNHQKKLELKSDLVSQISESVVNIVMAVLYAVLGTKSLTPEKYDEAFRDWQIRQAVIGSQIRAYFPREIGDEWGAYSKIVTNFYELSGADNVPFVKERLGEIRKYFSKSKVDWDTLAIPYLRCQPAERTKYQEAWDPLKEELLKKKDEVVEHILKSRISAF